MFYRRSWALAASAVAVAALLALGPPVRAAFQLQLTDLGTSTIPGGNLTPTSNGSTVTVPGVNTASFTGSIGAFSVIADTGLGNSPGSPAIGFANNSTTLITNTSGVNDTIQIVVSNTGFTKPIAPLPLLMDDSFSGTLQLGSGNIAAQGYGDTTNALNGTGTAATLLSATGLTTGTSVSLNGSPVVFNPTGITPYSLTYIIDVELGAGGSLLVGDDGQVHVVGSPEPASLALWISGLPVLGLARFWRRRQRGPLAVA